MRLQNVSCSIRTSLLVQHKDGAAKIQSATQSAALASAGSTTITKPWYNLHCIPCGAAVMLQEERKEDLRRKCIVC